MGMSTKSNAKNWFEEWREPGEFFRAAAEGVIRAFAPTRHPPQHLRDAYVAGAFTRIWRDDQGAVRGTACAEAGAVPDAQLRATPNGGRLKSSTVWRRS